MIVDLIEMKKIRVFKNEEDTEQANWIFCVRVIDNVKSIKDTFQFFIENKVETRPFFYPLASHYHLRELCIEETIIPEVLNKEVLFIPSSPKISYIEQVQVIYALRLFVLDNMNIEVIEIKYNNDDHVKIVKEFVDRISSSSFRYFQSREIDVLQNHVVTLILREKNTLETIGYSHIDYDRTNSKYWFGIFVDERYRNLKVGQQLLNLILNHPNVIVSSISKIFLSVDSDNSRAIHIYKKYGFEVYEESHVNVYMKRELSNSEGGLTC